MRLRWSHVDFEGRRVFIGANEDFTTAAMTIAREARSESRLALCRFQRQLESLFRNAGDGEQPLADTPIGDP